MPLLQKEAALMFPKKAGVPTVYKAATASTSHHSQVPKPALNS